MSNTATPTNSTSAQDAFLLAGRILISSLFIPAGFAKIMGFSGTVAYINSKGVPLPEIAAVLAIFIEVGVGIAFLVGYKVRWAALIMAVFA